MNTQTRTSGSDGPAKPRVERGARPAGKQEPDALMRLATVALLLLRQRVMIPAPARGNLGNTLTLVETRGYAAKQEPPHRYCADL